MRRIILLLAVLALSACTPLISPQSMSLVDKGATFREVKGSPEQHAGKNLLLGGAIASVKNSEKGGELEIVQLPTDDGGRPQTTRMSEGRFLARVDRFLDPMIYEPGLLVSLVGEVKGKETRELEKIEYTYPVLQVREIHLLRPEDVRAEPRVHFGIGIGIGHSF